MQDIPFHPVANIFPLIQGKEFKDLVEDIETNGLHESIVLYEGQILDGRNRFRACQESGTEADFVEYEGIDPVGYVLSLNLHRRHLNESQRAMIGANIANLESGRPEKGANLHGNSASEAGEKLNVSERSIKTAKKVKNEGTPELIEAVQEGKVSVSAAADVAALTEDDQAEIIKDINSGTKVRDAIKKHVHVSKNSGNNEWYTPDHIIESAVAVMGEIDLDPASSEIANQTVQAKKYFTIEDDGLSKEWCGRVWMNPPYAQPLIQQFSDKLCQSIDDMKIDQAIVLVNNATETAWFQNMARRASAICFPEKRIRFKDPEGNPSGSPLQGQAILYFGANVGFEGNGGFVDVFSLSHGEVFIK